MVSTYVAPSGVMVTESMVIPLSANSAVNTERKYKPGDFVRV